jgi:hypothetical protein
MAGKYGTSFTESEALLAIINEDSEHAEKIVNDMLPNERRLLVMACDELSAMAFIKNRDG